MRERLKVGYLTKEKAAIKSIAQSTFKTMDYQVNVSNCKWSRKKSRSTWNRFNKTKIQMIFSMRLQNSNNNNKYHFESLRTRAKVIVDANIEFELLNHSDEIQFLCVFNLRVLASNFWALQNGANILLTFRVLFTSRESRRKWKLNAFMEFFAIRIK